MCAEEFEREIDELIAAADRAGQSIDNYVRSRPRFSERVRRAAIKAKRRQPIEVESVTAHDD